MCRTLQGQATAVTQVPVSPFLLLRPAAAVRILLVPRNGCSARKLSIRGDISSLHSLKLRSSLLAPSTPLRDLHPPFSSHAARACRMPHAAWLLCHGGKREGTCMSHERNHRKTSCDFCSWITFFRLPIKSYSEVWGRCNIINTHSKNLIRGYGLSSFWGAKTPRIKQNKTTCGQWTRETDYVWLLKI
jgi:hypothetical protein